MNSFSTTAAATDNDNDEIRMGAVIRSEKIERACRIATATREQRQQQQQVLEGKLQANERGLTELRKLVDNWKGGEESVLQKLEAVVLMKEKECDITRKQVADTFIRGGSMPRSPNFLKIQKQASSKSKKASTRRHLMLQTHHATEHSVRLVPKVVVRMKEREKVLVEAKASSKWGSASAKSKKHSVTRRVVAPSA